MLTATSYAYSGQHHVKGGSWRTELAEMVTSKVVRFPDSQVAEDLGFRCAMTDPNMVRQKKK